MKTILSFAIVAGTLVASTGLVSANPLSGYPEWAQVALSPPTHR